MISPRIRHPRQVLVALGGAAALLTATVPPAHAATHPSGELAQRLQQTMAGLTFGDLVDSAPPGSAQARALAAQPESESGRPKDAPALKAAAGTTIHQQPQVDVTVIELDKKGRPVSSGTVLMSPQYKDGVVVPVDKNLRTTAVRYRLWNDTEWDANNGRGTTDTVPGRENAPIDFMEPYPASIIKLTVGFGILQLVDKGVIKLSDTYAYTPTKASDRCEGATTRTIGEYFDRMITISDNGATCSLIKLMHEHGGVDWLNQRFQELGLDMLQLKGTDPANGDWSPQVTMSSLDTAKLLMLLNGVPGKAWTAPNGKAVTSDVLSRSSREFFLKELGEQGWNNVLSTTNYCGYTYPAAGMPQRIAQRWIGPDGTVTVNEDPTDGKYLYPVQPCQDAAQVTFAHKTGLTAVAAGDAGIVHSLPGQAKRDYIIVAFSNLGWRYKDTNRPDPGVQPAVNRTEKFAKLGRAMDDYEAGR
ncbi:class A beta-lactamase-related serine hydrolase [Actinoallomurus spadix]|uniref:Beta-lactamase class A catalytic domain-containing protein n=1 Tax=Actinoallomurus spadix TaxID=79912 RepID=A0ABN0X1U4_9ACTN|nr:serine hydrolase [Actinoallomurus spadix]MCO5991491.1 class A beta-lactamase-related serine hydrolase [Actinoallomurus spadix]